MSSPQSTTTIYVDHVALTIAFSITATGYYSKGKLRNKIALYAHNPITSTSKNGQITLGGRQFLTNGLRVWRAMRGEPLPHRNRKIARHKLDNQLSNGEKDSLISAAGTDRPSRLIVQELQKRIIGEVRYMTGWNSGVELFPLSLNRFEMYAELLLAKDVGAARRRAHHAISVLYGKVRTHTVENRDLDDAYEYWTVKSKFGGKTIDTTVKAYRKGEFLRVEIVFEKPRLFKDRTRDQQRFFEDWFALERYGADLLYQLHNAITSSPDRDRIDADLVIQAIRHSCPTLGVHHRDQIRNSLLQDGIVCLPANFKKNRAFHYAMKKLSTVGLFEPRKRNHRSAGDGQPPKARGTDYFLIKNYEEVCRKILARPGRQKKRTPEVSQSNLAETINQIESSRRATQQEFSRLVQNPNMSLVVILENISRQIETPWMLQSLARRPKGR